MTSVKQRKRGNSVDCNSDNDNGILQTGSIKRIKVVFWGRKQERNRKESGWLLCSRNGKIQVHGKKQLQERMVKVSASSIALAGIIRTSNYNNFSSCFCRRSRLLQNRSCELSKISGKADAAELLARTCKLASKRASLQTMCDAYNSESGSQGTFVSSNLPAAHSLLRSSANVSRSRSGS